MNKVIKTGLTFSDVVIIPKHSSIPTRKAVNLSSRIGNYKLELPIIVAAIDNISNPKINQMALEYGALCASPRSADFDFIEKSNCISIGLIKDAVDEENLEKIIASKSTAEQYIISLDIANAHNDSIIKTVNKLNKYQATNDNMNIMVGNVVTPEAVNYLADLGVEIVKVGIGPSLLCSTREQTGCGYPQLSAIMDCAETADLRGVHLVADGGIKNTGDIAKALAAGADAVMVGSLFAGTDLTIPSGMHPSLLEVGHPLPYYGMASAMGKKSMKLKDVSNIEGREKTFPFRGVDSTDKLFKSISENLRSSLSYVGAQNLEEFYMKAFFVELSSGSVKESQF